MRSRAGKVTASFDSDNPSLTLHLPNGIGPVKTDLYALCTLPPIITFDSSYLVTRLTAAPALSASAAVMPRTTFDVPPAMCDCGRSKTPGKTQQYNYFLMNPGRGLGEFHLVDMPGLGFAKVPHADLYIRTSM